VYTEISPPTLTPNPKKKRKKREEKHQNKNPLKKAATNPTFHNSIHCTTASLQRIKDTEGRKERKGCFSSTFVGFFVGWFFYELCDPSPTSVPSIEKPIMTNLWMNHN
jgi:hypothetical protein